MSSNTRNIFKEVKALSENKKNANYLFKVHKNLVSSYIYMYTNIHIHI